MNKEIYIDSNFQFDPEDSRDHLFQPDTSIQLPLSADLRPHAREIENQGNTGSCVANATVSALEILLDKYSVYKDLSRLFLYYELRRPHENLHGKDKGSYTREGFKVPSKLGICKEDCWDFDVSKVNNKPKEDCYEEALNRKVHHYMRISSVDKVNSMKSALSNGLPILIGMPLSRDFYSIRGPLKDHDYKGYDPKTSVGGHAMCVVGYDDDLNGFIVENSWGKNWGDNGFCLISYDVAEKDMRDVWVCTAFENFKMDIEQLEVQKNIKVENYQQSHENEFEIKFNKSWIKKGNAAVTDIRKQYNSGASVIEQGNDFVKFKYNEPLHKDNDEFCTFFFYVKDNSVVPQTEVIYVTHNYKKGIRPKPPRDKKESWFQKNKKKLIIGGAVIVIGVLTYLSYTGVN